MCASTYRLAAANARLYLSAMDGKVICLGGVSKR